MSSYRCSSCGCTEIDRDPSRGDAVCTRCGLVLEESVIVSEVQYAQDCSGATRAVGQLVNADGNLPSGFNLGHSYGLGKESRAITLQNARRKISQLAIQLKLPDRCVDIAHNFYKMALAKKMTQGRRNAHVVAACVYMVCRKEETPHMLLDLSDILRINVYELGKTYLKLSTSLCINTPAMDPSLYILRFAHQLQFGDKTHDVSVTASRLIQRMKRDWMHTGRRPSGLCGAALLVAARLHNFSRTVDDVIKVVKVCQATVRKRLNEFGDTPSSRLTFDEFMTIDLEEEQDPPAFKAARRKKLPEFQDELKVQETTKEISDFQQLIEKALTDAKQKKAVSFATAVLSQGSVSGATDEDTAEQFLLNDIVDEVLQEDEEMNSSLEMCGALASFLMPASQSSYDSGFGSQLTNLSCSQNADDIDDPLTQDDVEEDCSLDISGLDDDEMNSFILNDKDTKSKSDFWFKTNQDFLKVKKEKEERKLKEELENSNKEQKKRKRRPKRGLSANTAEEAIEKMLQQKKISLKLDYTVLQNLNDTEPQEVEKIEALETDSQKDDERPAKKSRSSKPNIFKSPLPPSIRKGISDIIENARQSESHNFAKKSDEDIEDELNSDNEVSEVLSHQLPSNSSTDIMQQDVDDEDIEDEEEDEDDEDDDEGHRHFSAAELLGQRRDHAEPNYYDYDCDAVYDD